MPRSPRWDCDYTMIKSLKDVNDAYDDGRYHVSNFYKANILGGDQLWTDWSYSAGQPSYDARVGITGTFTPITSSGNSAIYIPPTGGLERKLAQINLVANPNLASQASCTFALYDLLGYYPLIDGDSTEVQTLNNTNPLPRYSNGEGVCALIINHVAPILNSCSGTVNVTGSNDVSADLTFDLKLGGLTNEINRSHLASNNAATAPWGPISFGFPSGAKGIKRINSIQFTTAPSGLFCIYMFKVITFTANHGDGASITRPATEKDMFIHSGFSAPTILDGANLGFFSRTITSNRPLNPLWGNLVFIWG